jgi:hypothetical protein
MLLVEEKRVRGFGGRPKRFLIVVYMAVYGHSTSWLRSYMAGREHTSKIMGSQKSEVSCLG